MVLPCFLFILLELFMSLNACSDFKWHLACIPFILLELFMSLNACLDIKWAYIVLLSYFWNYSCPLMHAWILNGLTLFSFHTLELFMSPNACF